MIEVIIYPAVLVVGITNTLLLTQIVTYGWTSSNWIIRHGYAFIGIPLVSTVLTVSIDMLYSPPDILVDTLKLLYFSVFITIILALKRE